MTPEYVGICRELSLPRKWQPGDAAWWTKEALVDNGNDDASPGVFHMSDNPEEWADDAASWEALGVFWLPREGDWLGLLEDEGYEGVCFDYVPDYDEGGPYFAFGDDEKVDPFGQGGDRLTALARLYVAVRGGR